MKRTTTCSKIVVGAALVSALVPGVALAADESYETSGLLMGSGAIVANVDAHEAGQGDGASSSLLVSVQSGLSAAAQAHVTDAASPLDATRVNASKASAVEVAPQAVQTVVAQVTQAHTELTDKVLSYNPADLAAIGTQASTGHTICCPSFSCAYADAVIDGTVHDHSYYVCSNCRWTDWGGGNSSYRCVGSDEQLLREAYDQISSGKATVIHVRASYGEHWIALIGYQGATDPDHLTLSNFIALDPWDGAQIVASDRFSLYGDGCEHISER